MHTRPICPTLTDGLQRIRFSAFLLCVLCVPAVNSFGCGWAALWNSHSILWNCCSLPGDGWRTRGLPPLARKLPEYLNIPVDHYPSRCELLTGTALACFYFGFGPPRNGTEKLAMLVFGSLVDPVYLSLGKGHSLPL